MMTYWVKAAKYDMELVQLREERLEVERMGVVTIEVEATLCEQVARYLQRHRSQEAATKVDHLRGMRTGGSGGVEVLIGRAGDAQVAGLAGDMQRVYGGEVRVQWAPERAAVTRDQFVAWLDMWPVLLKVRTDRRVEEGEEQGEMEWEVRECCALAGGITNGLPIAAMLVDPVTRTIVAKAVDARSSHPLHHAIMVCINAFAAVSEGGYLCAGLDMVTTHEPCSMCAMACVHSRVRRLVYVHSMERTGWIEDRVERCGLGWHKALNHRFLTFKMQCPPLNTLDAYTHA